MPPTFTPPSGMTGTIISVPPPRSELVTNEYVGIFKSTVPIDVQGISFDAGTYFIRSIEAPYSTIGAPPPYIPFRLLAEYRESNDRMQQQLTQHYDVPWNYRTFWQQSMMGDSYLDGQSRVRRHLPPTHPDYPQMIPMHCECVGGVGVPAGDQVQLTFLKRNNQGRTRDQDEVEEQETTTSRFGFARYAITWASVRFARQTDEQMDQHAIEEAGGTFPFDATYPPDLLDGQQAQNELHRFVTRHEDFATESITLSSLSGMQTVEATPKPIGEVPSKVFPLREVTYTWHQVPTVPIDNIEACLGKANNARFDTIPYVGGNYRPETLLFVGAKYMPGTSITGRLTYDIEYKWLFRPNGWRKNLQPGDTFTFVYLSTTGTLAGTFIYDVVEMPRLFRITI